MFVWMIRRSRPGGAYSSRKTAAPTPTGIAKTATRPSSQRLPAIPIRNPASAGSLDRGFVTSAARNENSSRTLSRQVVPGMVRRAAEHRREHRAEEDREHDHAGQRRQEAGDAEERAGEPPQAAMRLVVDRTRQARAHW